MWGVARLDHSAVPLRCTTLAYITRREAVYYLNLRLPKHFDPHRSTLRLSLGVKDRKTALFLASSIAYRVHTFISSHPLTESLQLRTLCASWLTETDLTATTPATVSDHPIEGPGTPSRTTKTLGALSKLYLAEGRRGGVWRTVSQLEVERALRDFFELMDDMPITAFGISEARTFKERLTRCPQYFGLRPEFNGMTLRQVVDSAKHYKTISPVTVNNRLRKLSAFLTWCQDNGYMKSNPLSGMKVKVGVAKDARLSFDRSDLGKVLNLTALKREGQKHAWRYWLPLLGRATGARLEELCQLFTDDIISLQGIPCIRIDDTHTEQKLKNESSRRVLPIHPELIQLGFLSYVDSIRLSASDRLFPDLEAKRDQLGHAPSKWFGRYRYKYGVSDPRKTFHSFRHTFIDDLRDAGVQDSLLKRLVGHVDGSVTFGVYGSRLPLEAMLNAITGLDLHVTQ